MLVAPNTARVEILWQFFSWSQDNLRGDPDIFQEKASRNATQLKACGTEYNTLRNTNKQVQLHFVLLQYSLKSAVPVKYRICFFTQTSLHFCVRPWYEVFYFHEFEYISYSWVCREQNENENNYIIWVLFSLRWYIRVRTILNHVLLECRFWFPIFSPHSRVRSDYLRMNIYEYESTSMNTIPLFWPGIIIRMPLWLKSLLSL